MRRAYGEVRVRVTEHAAEAAETALLELGATGTSQTLPTQNDGRRDPASHAPTAADAPAGTIEVVGYFAPDQVPDPAEIRTWIARLSAPATSDPDAAARLNDLPAISIRMQPWEDWVAKTRASFTTFAVTDRLYIVPPWEADAPTPAERLIIEPGEAFGTGRHVTTRACLELLDALATGARERRGAALDIGTGTGILALRAAQRGYRPVIAGDCDAIAAGTARTNLRLNAPLDGVHLYAGEAAALRVAPRFALILANLFFNPLAALAPVFERLLAPGGAIIVSGIEAGDGEALCKVFRACGLDPFDKRTHEGWVAYLLGRGGANEAPARPR
jgi:ribosomal protein L11 methyltransferase